MYMRNRFKIFFVFIVVILSGSYVDAAFKWNSLKNEHFTVFYRSGYEKEAWKVLEALERNRIKLQELTGYKVSHLSVVLEDVGTESNGITNPIFQSINIFTYPPPAGKYGYVQDWWVDVTTHEYTHILTLDNVGGLPGGMSFLFGNIFRPNIFLPGWISEGIAVYSESQISQYQGRLNDGFFDAYISACALENRMPSIKKATYRPLEFPLDSYYLYGGKFFDYLSKTYGEDRFSQFFTRNGSSFLSYFSVVFPYIGIDRSARRVYGKSFPTLWKEWLESEKKVAKDYPRRAQRLTKYGWRLKYLTFNNGKIYFVRVYPVKVDVFRVFWFRELIEREIETGKERCVVSTTSNFSLPVRVRGEKLYYGVYELKGGYDNTIYSTFGFTSAVHEKDLITGKDRLLFTDEVRALDVLPDGKIVYAKDRPHKFGSEIYLYDMNDSRKQLVFCTDYLVGEIVADDERTVVSARKNGENFNLYTMDLGSGEFTPLVRAPYSAFHISLSGDMLTFTMNCKKEYACYAYDFESGKLFKITEELFADYPAYCRDSNNLYFVGLHSSGNDIYRVKAHFKEFYLDDEPVSLNREVAIDTSSVAQGGYMDNIKTLFPPRGARVPLYYKDDVSSYYGLFFWGGDVIGHIPGYYGVVTYDSGEKRLGVSITANCRILSPLYTSLGFENIDDGSLTLYLAYPLVLKHTNGVNNLYMATLLRAFDNFDRMEVIPYMSMGITYPGTYLNFYLGVPIEKRELGSEIDRIGLYSTAAVSQYILGGELLIVAEGIYDPDNTSTVFRKIRGYDEEIGEKIGGMFTLEYSRPVVKVRNGLWNPSLFFEDIIAKVFFDSAVPDRGSCQYSTGLELHLETRVFIGLASDIGVRYSINRDRERRLDIFYMLPF